MKISQIIYRILFCSILLFLFSCRTEFEKIRTSGNGEIILENAQKFYDEKEYHKALTLYEIAIPAYRGKKEAEDIFYNYAYGHYYTKQYILSAHYFKNFANTFTNSPRREEADFMSAYSNYQLSPSHKLDQSYSIKAIEGFQLFANTYPNSERVLECNRLIEEMRDKMELKAFEEGVLYYNLGHYDSSVQSFENMIKDFPETEKAEYIRYIIAKSSYILAQNSVFNKKQERYLQAVEKCDSFIKKHSVSAYSKEILNYKNKSQSEIKKITS